MVKKFVYTLCGDYRDNGVTNEGTNKELLSLNDMLHNALITNKNNITVYHKCKKWDKYKKLTNDYELVFTSTQGLSSIANYNPISRSYFKLWEILKDYEEELDIPKESIKAVFLADAPGGFCEAFINKRGERREGDEIVTISLRATNKITPSWKLSQNYCQEHNITLFYGSSGTGDLYNIQNIYDLILRVGRNSCSFVTADGGFDFSSDFNNQEDMSIRLILCEIYTALNIQKEGGSFILKVFDLHKMTTMKLIYILKLFYENISFIKPLSSRPANSEKYVVCTGFKKEVQDSSRILSMLQKNIVTGKMNNILSGISLPKSFLADIVRYNRVYIAHQIKHIVKTVSLIDNAASLNINENVREQVRKAIKWCHKYNVPISISALHKYKEYY